MHATRRAPLLAQCGRAFRALLRRRSPGTRRAIRAEIRKGDDRRTASGADRGWWACRHVRIIRDRTDAYRAHRRSGRDRYLRQEMDTLPTEQDKMSNTMASEAGSWLMKRSKAAEYGAARSPFRHGASASPSVTPLRF